MKGSEGFYAAARKAKGNDRLPALIFADWLEENGYPEDAAAVRECPSVVKLLACLAPDLSRPAAYLAAVDRLIEEELLS